MYLAWMTPCPAVLLLDRFRISNCKLLLRHHLGMIRMRPCAFIAMQRSYRTRVVRPVFIAVTTLIAAFASTLKFIVAQAHTDLLDLRTLLRMSKDKLIWT